MEEQLAVHKGTGRLNHGGAAGCTQGNREVEPWRQDLKVDGSTHVL